MESKAKIAGHSAHQILIVFPLGLLSTAVIVDVIHYFNGNPTAAVVAYWMIVAGLLGGLIAAPFGLIDWLAVPRGTRAKSVGKVHGLVNVGVLILFALSWWLRYQASEGVPTSAFILSLCGAVCAAVGGWLGGELVSRLGVGVSDDANLNAPSSLSWTGPHSQAWAKGKAP